jgi:glycosyltransferase involved in cell wall biosynthesis
LKLQREGCKITADNYIIGCVGSLTYKKNQMMLIDAIKNIDELIRKKIVVLIVGEGPHKDMLQKASVDYGIADQVLFLGQRNDVDSLYAVFDVLVQCSVTEGMSNVILEAMASAVPVVCTKGCDEETEIVRDGINGIFVKNGDFEALSEAIIQLNDDALRQKMSLSAYDIITSQFSIKNMVAEYGVFYEQALTC